MKSKLGSYYCSNFLSKSIGQRPNLYFSKVSDSEGLRARLVNTAYLRDSHQILK